MNSKDEKKRKQFQEELLLLSDMKNKINRELQNLKVERTALEIKEQQLQEEYEKIQKQNPNKISHTLLQANFQDNWFCSYTDNISAHQHFEIGKAKIAVLTLHGCPGSLKEWLRLEKSVGKNKIRWINFIVPGFDGQDERRGTYNSSLHDVCTMIVKLLEKLNINKVFICGHSMGAFIACYFYQNFQNKCLGLITLGGAPITWYEGMKVFHKSIVEEFQQEKQKILSLDSDEERQKIAQKFIEISKKYSVTRKNVGTIQMLQLKVYEFFASFKLFGNSFGDGQQWDQIFSLIRNLRPGLKFFAGGNKDIIIEKEIFEHTFFHFSQGKKALINEIKYDKQQLINLVEKSKILQNHRKLLNFDNPQNNFIYLFENTGHPVHNRRGYELGLPILIYIEFSNIFQQCIIQDSSINQEINQQNLDENKEEKNNNEEQEIQQFQTRPKL
ncbi:hypothetical protein PPERSA_03607 [Pseudocohnilembus persalinus]|uniref:AB hydrolase-1 domain-containing protein n=1 Tax=Pseudocohnilembus persalinus TaxID=266149 RepID=A0A0V0QE03_PSEPJ|nr:hypothetical protein PPERSA_03607 [Pseudocohnilembus persalinus]|eukprot:KRX00386.1 hypothetical protein PPERSA_03607 [Pseudocohnilembus persalinus]